MSQRSGKREAYKELARKLSRSQKWTLVNMQKGAVDVDGSDENSFIELLAFVFHKSPDLLQTIIDSKEFLDERAEKEIEGGAAHISNQSEQEKDSS